MRSFCLIVLIVSGVMIVVADLASGLGDPSAPGADLAEHTSVTEVQRTASHIWKPHEERAFYIESLTAKLMKLLKSVKTKLASLYTSFFKSSTTKTAGMEHDANVIARYDQVAPAVDDHRFVPPGESPIIPGKPRVAPGEPAIGPGKPSVTSGKPLIGPDEYFTKLADKLHDDPRFHKMLAEVRGHKNFPVANMMFDMFLKSKGGIESEAAQTIHKMNRGTTKLLNEDRLCWRILRDAQYNRWILDKLNPEDVEAVVKKDGGEDAKEIAREVANSYKNYLVLILKTHLS
ncbi:unnamed protein product [Hyaloperonospora brassicae]|uniref:RxLR effector candidate protein n=1 Tax=Hyaloperonospora brassicae TaxID=162125 RepID=A0AAV0T7T7_HYABA|nr:unnamed protein product [Hyaloperonospora brassicae]